MLKYIELAKKVATLKDDRRCFRLGAVAVRSDGAIVAAYNSPSENKQPKAHAEHRLCRKIDKGATVYVVRIKADGSFGLAKPCKRCQIVLRKHQVKKVIYSTEEQKEFGVMYL